MTDPITDPAPDLYVTIADRLTATVAIPMQIRAATSAEQAEDETLGVVPVCLVVPAGERWTPPREAALRVTVPGVIAFSCVVALTFPAGTAEWTAARDAIRDALLGWTPADDQAAAPIHATGARLLAYSADQGGRWVHAFDFALPAQATYGVQT